MAKEAKINSSFFGNFTSSDDDDDVEEVPVKEVEENEELETEDELEEEEIVDGNDEEEELEDNDEPDPFIDTINYLAEKGIIDFDEDKIYEEEGEELLEVVFQESLEKQKQEWIDSIPEDYQSIIQHLQSGRPLDEWVDSIKPTNFDSIDIEDEATQKQLIEDHLTLTGMDDDDIKERLQELEDLGTLEKNAKTAIKYLKKNEDSRVAQYKTELADNVAYNKQVQEKQLEDFKETVLATEDLKGFKLKDKKERQQLLDYITKPTNSKGESRYVIETKGVDTQLALAYMAMKGFSFKDIERQAETKATSTLRKSLSQFSDINATGAKGSTGRVNTESKKIPKGPWG